MVTPPSVPATGASKSFPRPPQIPKTPAGSRGTALRPPVPTLVPAKIPKTSATNHTTASLPEPRLQKQPADQVIIRTMQEDLRTIAMPTPSKEKTPSGTVSKPTTTPSTATRPTFPLPATTTGRSSSNHVQQPAHRKKRYLIPALIVLLTLVVIGSGSTVAWLLLRDDQATSEKNDTLGNAQDNIPADSALVIQYQLTSATDRTAILSAWNQPTPASVTTLLRGDPRLLLNDSAIEEFYYILLPDDNRPYLLTRETPGSQDLLSNTADAAVANHNGWIIAHSLDTAPYLQALTENTLAAVGGEDVFLTTTPDTPVRLLLGPAALTNLRADILGEALQNGDIQSAGIASRFAIGQLALTISGAANTLSSVAPSSSTVDHKILSYIPATSAATSLGSNFASDMTSITTTTGELDKTILQQPEVAALLAQLNTPYGFFVDSSAPGGIAYGLIVQLPANFNSTTPLGDPTLETALRALVPLLTGRKSVAPLEFNNGTYRDIPLRFVNITGGTTAIDYAKDGSYLLIASNKDTMFTLLDAAAGQTAPLNTAPQWFELFSLWGALPQTQRMIVATTTNPTLRQFLPQNPQAIQFGIMLDSTPGNPTTQHLQGVVKLVTGT